MEENALLDRNPGVNPDLSFIVGREWVLKDTNWSNLQTRGTMIDSFQPMHLIAQKPQVRAIMDLFHYCRFDVEVTIEVISTFNMSGLLMICPYHVDWLPGRYPTGEPDIKTRSLLPHYLVFASDQNVVRFTLPFQSPFDYGFCHYDPIGAFGYQPHTNWPYQWTVNIVVMHPLSAASDDSFNCNVICRAKLINPVFVLPHILDDELAKAEMEAGQFIDLDLQAQSATARERRAARMSGQSREARQVAEEGVVSGFLKAGARFSKWAGDISGFSSIGSAIAGAANMLGTAAESLGFQKPAQVSAPQLIAMNNKMDKRSIQARGVSDSFTFNLGTENDQSIDEDQFAFSTQTNDFRQYACIPGQLVYTVIDATTSPGTLLGELPLYPHRWLDEVAGADVRVCPAAAAAMLCQAYTGDLQHMLVVSSSKFVTIKLAVQVGTHLSGIPSLSSIGDTLTKVFTINGSGVIQFRTPYFNYRRVVDTTKLAKPERLHVHLFMVSASVQVPGTSATGIQTHIDWYAAFGPNCRFFVPNASGNYDGDTNTFDLSSPDWMPAGAGIPVMDSAKKLTLTSALSIQCDPRAEFRKVFEPLVADRLVVYEDALYPDEIESWNDIRMRPVKVDTAQVGVVPSRLSSTVVVVSENPPVMYQPWWFKAYARWRANMRYVRASSVSGVVGMAAAWTNTIIPTVTVGVPGTSGMQYLDCTQPSSASWNNTHQIEVPRWRTTLYDSRLFVASGMEHVGSEGSTYVVLAYCAGENTQGFVPMGFIKNVALSEVPFSKDPARVKYAKRV